jgi:hypothetical protein
LRATICPPESLEDVAGAHVAALSEQLEHAILTTDAHCRIRVQVWDARDE